MGNNDQLDLICKNINSKTGQVCNAYLGSVGPTAIVRFLCRKCKHSTEYRRISTDVEIMLKFKFIDNNNTKRL